MWIIPDWLSGHPFREVGRVPSSFLALGSAIHHYSSLFDVITGGMGLSLILGIQAQICSAMFQESTKEEESFFLKAWKHLLIHQSHNAHIYTQQEEILSI